MADYFLDLSFQVKWPEPAMKFACDLADAWDKVVCGDAAEVTPDIVEIVRRLGAEEDGSTQGAHFSIDEQGLWIHTDESASPEVIVPLLQETMKKFDIHEAVGFEWSNSCSKPRLDAYGGGAVVFTKDEASWTNTGRWMEEQLKDMGWHISLQTPAVRLAKTNGAQIRYRPDDQKWLVLDQSGIQLWGEDFDSAEAAARTYCERTGLADQARAFFAAPEETKPA